MNNKQKNFENLYKCIQSCTLCPHVQSEKVIRVINKVNIKSSTIIIAEAMASSQVRLSWINYFDVNWKIWNTWIMLEKFLHKLWLSVYPENENCVYNTEIVHCFPWHIEKKWKKSIRRPSKDETQNCISQGFILEEIKLVNPNIIFLMGKTSYEAFYNNFLWKKTKLNLTSKIEEIKKSKKIDFYNWYPLFPIQHASWANPRFSKMLKDDEYIEIIKSYITKRI